MSQSRYRKDQQWLLALVERDGRQCWYCGVLLGLSKDMICRPESGGFTLPVNMRSPTRDHIIPRSKGGTNRLDNLVLACRTCNCTKGKKTLEEYRAWMESKRGEYVTFYAEARV